MHRSGPLWFDGTGGSKRVGLVKHHARIHDVGRQWHLRDDFSLKYHYLGAFDVAMLATIKADHVVGSCPPRFLHIHEDQKVLAFERNGDVFIFNFHPVGFYPDTHIEVPAGQYASVLDTDEPRFGGFERRPSGQVHETEALLDGNLLRHSLRLYLPARTALVLKQTAGPSEAQVQSAMHLLAQVRE